MISPGQIHLLIRNPDRNSWFRFVDPELVLCVTDHPSVIPLLRHVEAAVETEGYAAAGFIAYEAAPAFDTALTVRPDTEFPLAWFVLSKVVEEVPVEEIRKWAGASPHCEWNASVTENEYRSAVRTIRAHIAEGDTYQVNYSYRLRSRFTGDPRAFFARLSAAQPSPFAAYLDTGRYVICSASPELFFRQEGHALTSRPMKGTARRGLTLEDDHATAERLRVSAKEQAENVMIVDMMRNDIGRIARTESVRVSQLFTLEKYPTLWQLTSTVEGTTDAGLSDVMSALFPAASVTGAPKPRTMQIIRALESTPRRIYTGAIGCMFPGRRRVFSVAIRTALIDRQSETAEYGVGGGIVWDSTESGELAESRTKALVLTEPQPEFSLLETMLWTPEEGYFLLEYHCERMAGSADYFSMPFDATLFRSRLAERAGTYGRNAQKVRVLLSQDGELTLESERWRPLKPAEPPAVRIAAAPVCTSDRFLYHKTTNRPAYEAARGGLSDGDDVILWNERGEMTESTIANLVVELDGRAITPPVSSGLLPGVYRRWMLERGVVREGVITKADLARAAKVWLVNSVRGQYEVNVSHELSGGEDRAPTTHV